MRKDTLCLLCMSDIFVFVFSVNGECCTDIFYSRPIPTQNSNTPHNQIFCTIEISSKQKITCLDQENKKITEEKQKEKDKKIRTQYKISLNPNTNQIQIKIQEDISKKEYTFTIFYATTVGFYTNEKQYYITRTLLANANKEIKTDKKKKKLNNDRENTIRINID